MQTDRFQDSRYGNWLKVSLALVYMKEGLEDFAEKQSRSLHANIRATRLQQGCPSIVTGTACTQCSSRSIRKKAGVWSFQPRCPVNVCDDWMKEILTNHVHLPCPNISWDNTDPKLWPTDSWEVAKIFQPHGCQGHSSPSDCDAAAVLTLMKDCRHFHQFITNIGILQKIKDIRNKTMHTNDMLVDDTTMVTDVNTIIQLLQDPQHLVHLNPSKEAVKKIEELRDNITDLSLNRELELKALNQRTATIQTDVRQLQDKYKVLNDEIDQIKTQNDKTQTICGEYKQKIERLKELSIDMKRVSTEIDKFKEFTRQSTNDMKHVNDRLQKHKSDLQQLLLEVDKQETVLRQHEREIQKLAEDMKRHDRTLNKHGEHIDILYKRSDKQAAKHKDMKEKKLKYRKAVSEKFHGTKLEQSKLTQRVVQQEKATMVTQSRYNVLEKAFADGKTEIFETKKSVTDTIKRVDVLEVKQQFDTDFDLTKVQNDLMRLFEKNNFSQLPISPFDVDDNINLEDIYTELFIIDIQKQASKSSDKSDAQEDEQYSRYKSAFFMHEFRYKEGKKVDSLQHIKEEGDKQFKRIILQGDAGCGKTTWCCKIVRDWVIAHEQKQNHEFTLTQKKLLEFELLFPIIMSELRDNSDFEETLKSQVFGKDTNVDFKRLKKFLYSNPAKVLFLLDGFDECTTSSGFINDLIAFKCLGLHDVGILMTSRPWKVDSLITKKHIERVVEVRGFDEENISNYVVKYLRAAGYNDKQIGIEYSQFLSYVEGTVIYNLVRIPMLLLLICHIWIKHKMDSTTYTGIYKQMFDLYLNRLAEKSSACEMDMILKERETIVLKLGEFAWSTAVSSNLEENSLLFEQSDITKYIAADVLQDCQKIGLISKSRSFSFRNKTVTLSFPHRSMHEFLAAYYLANCGNGEELVKSHINSEFVDSLFSIANILLFVCGLDASLGIKMLNAFSNRLQIHDRQIRTNFLLFYCHEFLIKNNQEALEGISVLMFCRLDILEKKLLQMCKSCVQCIYLDCVDNTLKCPEALSHEDFQSLSHVSLQACQISGRLDLSYSVEHVILCDITMESTNWQLFFKGMTDRKNLKSLQIYFCTDKNKGMLGSTQVIGFPNDYHIDCICFAACSFKTTKFLLPVNTNFKFCRILDCAFNENQRPNIINSLSNLRKLEILIIDNCNFVQVKLPKMECLKNFVLNGNDLENIFWNCLNSMVNCLRLFNIHISNYENKVLMIETNTYIPPLYTKDDFEFVIIRRFNIFFIENINIFNNTGSFPPLKFVSELRIENTHTKIDLIGSSCNMRFLQKIIIKRCTILSDCLHLPVESIVEKLELGHVVLSVKGCESLFQSLAKQKHLLQCIFGYVRVVDRMSNTITTDDFFSAYTSDERKIKVELLHCQFGEALIHCPSLKLDYTLEINSVEMSANGWTNIFSMAHSCLLKGICVKSCVLHDIHTSFFHLPGTTMLESFIIESTTLSQLCCNNICRTLSKQKLLKLCSFNNVNVGSKIPLPSSMSSQSGIAFTNCDFAQADVVLPSLDNCYSVTFSSVNMSRASWAQVFSVLKSTTKQIVLENCNVDNSEIMLDCVPSLSRVRLANVSPSVLQLCMPKQVYHSKCSKSYQVNIELENVRLLAQNWQAMFDSLIYLERPFNIILKEINVEDSTFKPGTKTVSLQLQSVKTCPNSKLITSFCNVDKLEKLHLIDMHIRKPFPSLPNLHYLRLQNITVYDFAQFFKDISFLPSLCSLRLSNCDFSVCSEEIVVPKMQSFQSVDLNDITMHPTTNQWCAFLRSLSMSHSIHTLRISGDKHIHHQCIEHQCMISRLRLKDNTIALPDSRNITELIVEQTEMRPCNWQSLVTSFANFSALTSLDIRSCYIGEGEVIEFPEIPNLTSFTIYNVLMKEDSWSQLALSLRNKLSRLILSECIYEGELKPNTTYGGTDNTPVINIRSCILGQSRVSFPRSSEIKTLVLQRITLTNEGWGYLVSSIGRLVSLDTFEISECDVAIQIVDGQLFPDSLSRVSLINVYMTCEHWRTLFEQFGYLTNIRSCRLAGCMSYKCEQTITSDNCHGNEGTYYIDGCKFKNTFIGVSDGWNIEKVIIRETQMDEQTQMSLFQSLDQLYELRDIKIANGHSGNIGESVFYCENVKRLNLEFGNVPYQLHRLNKGSRVLKELHLDHSQHKPYSHLVMPSGLEHISVLSMSGFHFPPKKQNLILSSILELSSLTHLSLAKMTINYQLRVIEELKSLEWLSLKHIVMPETCLSNLFECLKMKTKLFYLNIRDLSEAFENKKNIAVTKFNELNAYTLAEVKIEDCDLNVIVELPRFTKDHSFFIKNVKLTKKSWQVLFSSLTSSSITVNDCEIDEADIQAPVNAVLKSVSLTRVRMAQHTLSNFMSSLSGQTFLEDIVIQEYNMNTCGNIIDMDYLNSGINRKIMLYRCNLSKTTMSNFPKYIKVFNLDLFAINLQGSQWEDVFRYFGFLPNLQNITISNCILENCNPCFPSSCTVKTVALIKVAVTSNTGWSQMISSCSNLATLQTLSINGCSHDCHIHKDVSQKFCTLTDQSRAIIILHSDFGEIKILLPALKKIEEVEIKSSIMGKRCWESFISSLSNIERLKTVSIEGMSIVEELIPNKPCIPITTLETLTTQIKQMHDDNTMKIVKVVLNQCSIDVNVKGRSLFKDIDSLVLMKLQGPQEMIGVFIKDIAQNNKLNKFHICNHQNEYRIFDLSSDIDFGILGFSGLEFDLPYLTNATCVHFSGLHIDSIVERCLMHSLYVKHLNIVCNDDWCNIYFPVNKTIKYLTICFGQRYESPTQTLLTIHNLANLVTLEIYRLSFINSSSSSYPCLSWKIFANEINKLGILKTLILHTCRMPKEGWLERITIPGLKELSLTSIAVSVKDPYVYKNVFELISNMSQSISRLKMCHLKFGEDDFRILNLPNLEQLCVVYCDVLEKCDISNLYSALMVSGNIHQLECSGKFFESLLSVSNCLEHVTTLSLFSTNISKEIPLELQECLSEMPNAFAMNMFNTSKYLATSHCLPNIKQLDLISVSMYPDEWVAMFTDYSNMLHLNHVVVCYCYTHSKENFIDETRFIFSQWQKMKEKRKILNADIDELSEDGMVVTDSDFADSKIKLPLLPNIRRLVMCKVIMSELSWQNFFTSLENIQNIGIVSIRGCSSDTLISTETGKCTNVQGQLTIANCDFGNSKIKIPKLVNITSVRLQDIHGIETVETMVNNLDNIGHLEELLIKKQKFRKPSPSIPKIEKLNKVVLDHIGCDWEYDPQRDLMSQNGGLSLDTESRVSYPCRCFSASYFKINT